MLVNSAVLPGNPGLSAGFARVLDSVRFFVEDRALMLVASTMVPVLIFSPLSKKAAQFAWGASFQHFSSDLAVGCASSPSRVSWYLHISRYSVARVTPRMRAASEQLF